LIGRDPEAKLGLRFDRRARRNRGEKLEAPKDAAELSTIGRASMDHKRKDADLSWICDLRGRFRGIAP
jgi:hypothetical protein